MPEHLQQASDLTRDFTIASIQSTIVDVPTVRRHKLSQTSVTAQSYVLVQVRLANGAEGIGEAATLGGPRWSEESTEAMKANIDVYLAPSLLARPPRRPVRGGRYPDGPGRQAQQRRQGRHRNGNVRRSGQDP
jgi:muconate cycloisomerase